MLSDLSKMLLFGKELNKELSCKVDSMAFNTVFTISYFSYITVASAPIHAFLEFPFYKSMGECNTIPSSYTMYRHLE